MTWTLLCGDAQHLPLGAHSIDAIVTDPPYGLALLGKEWDRRVPDRAFWEEALRVAKPGAHMLAFGGTRTFHRLACAIEDAGWEIRDTVLWVYGNGFPKSLDVGKAIDKQAGYPQFAHDIGVAIKTAREARSLSVRECDQRFCGGTTNWSWFEGRPAGQRAPTPATFTKIAAAWPELAPLDAKFTQVEREVVGQGYRVQHESSVPLVPYGNGNYDITAPATDAAKQWDGWGTGALHIGVSRIPGNEDTARPQGKDIRGGNWSGHGGRSGLVTGGGTTRWPSNFIHDGSPEVLALFPESDVSGSARFFYTAKSSPAERSVDWAVKNEHPTVKPISLMQYLIRLICPPGGLILDPFAGSGSTLLAAKRLGVRSIGLELNPDYCAIARTRLTADAPLFADLE